MKSINKLFRNPNIYLNTNSNSTNSLNKVTLTRSTKNLFPLTHYCPYCTHCNSQSDPNLENLTLSCSKEAKNIISNSFEYILNNNIIDSNNMSIFSNNGDDKTLMHDIEILINHNSKQLSHKNSRLTYKVVAHFLDSLIDNKVSLENIITDSELLRKLEKTIVTKGLAFEVADEKILFDEELENLFDLNTKEEIQTLLRSIYILKNILNTREIFR